MAKQFRESLLADLVHTVYTYMLFLFDASTEKLFESFYYHVLFCFCFCLAAVVVQANTANNIQYL